MNSATSPSVTVIVVAGGAGRRFGSNKLIARLDDSTVLNRTLDSIPAHWQVMCVGPQVTTDRRVGWTREVPAGSGPAAGLGAGVCAAGVTGEWPDYLAVLAGDMPDGGQALPDLLAHIGDADGCLAVDQESHVQNLLGAFRTSALVNAVVSLGDLRDTPVRSIYSNLALTTRNIPGRATHDIDTPDDLQRFSR